MKLRYLENYTDVPCLQYYDEDKKQWQNVPIVYMNYKDGKIYNRNTGELYDERGY